MAPHSGFGDILCHAVTVAAALFGVKTRGNAACLADPAESHLLRPKVSKVLEAAHR